MQISVPPLLLPVLQLITQLLILTKANLIPTISPTPISYLYLKILLSHEVDYFSQDLLVNVKNYKANNEFAVTVNSSRSTKEYLVYKRGTKSCNRYNLTKETGTQLIGCQF